MKIEIWSDFACPYCYIGEKKLEKALEEMQLVHDVELGFRSFQLDVNATSHPDEDINTLISKKYNISYEQAQSANDGIVARAKQVGLNYDFDNLKPSNTSLAHQLMKYAKLKNKEAQIAERLFSAYFVEGVELGDVKNIKKIAALENLDSKEIEELINEQTFYEEVMKDQELAHELGISSVPFFVINNKYAVSGAQSVEYFKSALQKAMEE